MNPGDKCLVCYGKGTVPGHHPATSTVRSCPFPECDKGIIRPSAIEPTLLDLADMPSWNPRAGAHGLHSVSEDKVFWDGPNKVACRQHGAMLAVNPDCTIWRCIACNEGAFLVRSENRTEVAPPKLNAQEYARAVHDKVMAGRYNPPVWTLASELTAGEINGGVEMLDGGDS